MELTYKAKNMALKVIHRNDFQNAPTLVFLHDSLGCIQLWRDFPFLLATQSKCNLLIYDRQGYGKSSRFTEKVRENDYMEKEAEVLIELLKKLKINNPILFGHSDGGTIALLEAENYPKIIKGIITEGAHVFV
jgi:pimeloyl-ACP methyl ester carboxylesterase